MTEQRAATLYPRLGGYDAIAAVADDLLPHLMSDPQLGRFWAHRAADSIRREKQLLIDFLCASAGGSCIIRAEISRERASLKSDNGMTKRSGRRCIR